MKYPKSEANKQTNMDPKRERKNHPDGGSGNFTMRVFVVVDVVVLIIPIVAVAVLQSEFINNIKSPR